jgi:hypothetical protein
MSRRGGGGGGVGLRTFCTESDEEMLSGSEE